MREKTVSRTIVLLLLVGAVMLPVAISMLFGLNRLLAAMGDSDGAAALGWIALAAAVFWVLDLVALVVVQAVESLSAGESSSPTQDPPPPIR